MSPEQILGKEVDRRSDIFSIGIVLWEALAARRLFSRDTDFLTFQAITEANATDIRDLRPDVSEALAAVLKKALARKRDDRYPTAEALKLALEEAVPEHFAPQKIAEDISARFSKELASKRRLTTNITEQLQAIPGAAEESAPTPRPPVLPRQPHEPALQVSGQVFTTEEPSESEAETVASNPLATELLREVKKSRRISLLIATAAIFAVAGAAFWVSAQRDPTSEPKSSPAKDEVPRTSEAKEPAPQSPPSEARAAGPSEARAAGPSEARAAGPQQAGDATKPLAPDAGPTDAAISGVPPTQAAKADNRPAFLTVDSSPYATIFIDGKKVGVTPIFKLKLKPGRYRMRAVSATGAKQSLRVKLKAGRTINLGRLKW